MKIRFTARFIKNNKQVIDEEEKKLAELLGKEYRQEVQVEYEYQPLIQDVDNIVGFNQYNSGHTALRTKLGEVFVVRGDVSDVERRWVEVTGEDIVIF